ncbi:3-phosphoserine/phosphohydroxythreonine transaminase [Reinekea marinisedimentorum]|uniref:Phosphoserine aminotransferase n=1 Tax=Reinekea marinisedimentorum TaxID=230495 RepID=A0A4R3I5C7_9GAMM|nr:3-phosphoserine/phosphohydroxythreonine transaminase [Reinekea marinisedimentorum]TCS39985.1 phosphoserine aminotransferase [Reinekea marinisedimentorum]
MAGANRTYNFCSGPAMLPEEVLLKAQSELLSYQGCGMSVMSLSHRSDAFLSILSQAENRLRSLLNIPDHYHVLFTQGGASAQFASIPLNLMQPGKPGGYLDSGYWAQKAIAEAERYGPVKVVASAAESNYSRALLNGEYSVGAKLSYLHYTPNETIDGVAFPDVPQSGQVPLVADMSSCILSAPLNVADFGVIYAGAQKNIGPAGLTLVIIRDDLLERCGDRVPRLMNYATLASQNSMANTPPTFAIYMANLVFEWLLENGGIPQIEKQNQRKAELLYNAIDSSSLFTNAVEQGSRSAMNVPFSCASAELNERFVRQAEQAGLMNLKGHRSRGGMRASIYNAMPYSGVEALVNFMQKFESQYV